METISYGVFWKQGMLPDKSRYLTNETTDLSCRSDPDRERLHIFHLALCVPLCCAQNDRYGAKRRAGDESVLQIFLFSWHISAVSFRNARDDIDAFRALLVNVVTTETKHTKNHIDCEGEREWCF